MTNPTKIENTDVGVVVMPVDHDPAEVTAETLQSDERLRRLDDDALVAIHAADDPDEESEVFYIVTADQAAASIEAVRAEVGGDFWMATPIDELEGFDLETMSEGGFHSIRSHIRRS